MHTLLIILAGLVVAAVGYLLIRSRLGRLQSVSIHLPEDPAGRRTPGEVHRELWEQKGTLDRAIEQTAAMNLNNRLKLQQAQAVPVRGWHAPDAPCEVER